MSKDTSSLICNIIKSDTSKIINKLEMKLPAHFQMGFDMYKEYLHSMDDIFGTCISSEKMFFDKMKLDANSIKNVELYSNYLTSIWLEQIENCDNFLKWYSEINTSNMKSYDQFVHTMMAPFSKI